MTPARKLAAAPPPPASHTRTKAPPRTLAELRLEAHRVLATIPAEVFALRAEADTRRGDARERGDHTAKVERRSAVRLDQEAAALSDAAEELAWLMALGSPP